MTVIQGTPEWFAQRIGKATASRIVDVIAKIKTGEAATRATYRAELVAERLTGKAMESFSNASMKWGIDCEPLARAAYEAETGFLVVETGMLEHPSIGMTGASPDGLVSTDGMLEIKCPETKTHIETILSGEAPSKYMAQMQWQMACANRAWVDFVSYDPRLPTNMQLFIVRVPRNEKLITIYECEVVKFLAEVENTVERLRLWKRAA